MSALLLTAWIANCQTPPASATGVDWNQTLSQSLIFLGIEHGFRYATEPGTRHPDRPFLAGYVNSLENLHGWADGDPLLVNYVGHPLQGAVTGFIFAQNDRSFADVEFGTGRRYWKGRLRAAGYGLLYSEQFELGPLSEASIGNVQASYPQQGFVDQVVTPSFGLAWMIAEDAADRFLVRRIERHTNNRYLRYVARGALNPGRSMANMVAGRTPWYRERPAPAPPASLEQTERLYPLAALFELQIAGRGTQYFGDRAPGPCLGGGVASALRVAPHWQWVGEVGGCSLTSLAPKVRDTSQSGDSLTYLTGLRWDPRPASLVQPFVQVQAGGQTVTFDTVDTAKEALVKSLAAREARRLSHSEAASYHSFSSGTAPAFAVGSGVDMRLGAAVALRLAQVDYLRSSNATLAGQHWQSGLRWTSGVVIRFGTW